MKRIAIVFISVTLILSGCRTHKNPEQDRRIVVSFSIKSLSNVVSSSTSDEDAISKVILFGVSAKGAVLGKHLITINNSLEGIPLTISQEVKSLYTIANPSVTLQSVNPLTVSDLMTLTDDITYAPVSPFLMSGKTDVNVDNSINIELVRFVAKIVVVGEDGFQIQSVTVKNTPSKGFVFTQPTLSLPASSGKVDYMDITNSTIYVAENSRQNPTTLIVKGTMAGIPVGEIAVNFVKNGQTIDIERNTCYKATIMPDPEHNADISINIVGWDDVDLDPTYFEY